MSRDRSDLEPGDLLDEVLGELHLTITRFPRAVARRGLDYFVRRRVRQPVFAPGQVTAAVRGSETYQTSWRLGASGWRSACSCPVGPICKHAYALACVLVDLFEIGSLGKAQTSALFAGLHAKEVTAPVPGPPAGPPRPESFGDMQAARSLQARRGLLHRLLDDARLLPDDAQRHSLLAFLDERDHDVLGWLLAREIAHLTGGALPASLEAYRQRPELAERAARGRREQVTDQLLHWSQAAPNRPARSLCLRIGLRPEPFGMARATPEMRLTSARLRDEPRTFDQLRALQSQAMSSPDLLTRSQTELLDAYLDAASALHDAWGLSYRRTRKGVLSEFLLAVLPSADVIWDPDMSPALAARAGITPGDPVRIEGRPARITPSFTPVGAEARLELTVAWPDGRREPYAALLHVLEQGSRGHGLLLAAGAFHTIASAPPGEVLQRFAITPSIPISRAEGAPLLNALAPALDGGLEALAAFTRVHDVEPIVLMDLDDRDDWIRFVLLARIREGEWAPGQPLEPATNVFEYVPGGRWVRWAGKPGARRKAPADDAWLHLPSPDQTKSITSWVESLDAIPYRPRTEPRAPGASAEQPAWWVRLDRRGVQRLAEHWEGRPQDVHWLANPEMRRLLEAGRSLSPRVSARRFGVDLLAISAEWQAEGLTLTDADLARLRTSREPWVKLSGGWVQRAALAVHDEALEILSDLGVEPGAGEQTLSLWQLAQARPESLERLEHMGVDAAAITAVRELRKRVATFAGLPACPKPAALVAELRPYQQAGLDFLAHASSLGLGSLLADDMGLGKTVQALAWLLHLRAGERRPGPALVVCPASVVHNWEREAQKFAPSLRVLLLTSGARRMENLRALDRHDLVITNYALLRLDRERWAERELFAVILDEAQQIKNPQAAVSAVARTLQARHRLALTGTPIENRALDLWSIVQAVSPGYLGDRATFTRRFDRADAPPHVRRLLAAKLRPMLLRRLKQDVAPELPDRIEERRDCEMTPGQRKLYADELKRAREDIMAMAATGIGRHKIEILAALTRLRQICCHPRLAGGRTGVGSGKFEALFELLEPLLAEGHKVLLFSQFVQALELVRGEMRKLRIPHHMLTGSTTNRPAVVRAFENDPEPCVFLISLKAGGTGLNLTAATYVVLLDPWWNPAVEAQAIDRTHRIGQDRTVIAYRLLMRGTIEEKIFELQQRKSDLARGVLGEDGFARSLDREALEYLFAE